jgi:hypothetical protein
MERLGKIMVEMVANPEVMIVELLWLREGELPRVAIICACLGLAQHCSKLMPKLATLTTGYQAVGASWHRTAEHNLGTQHHESSQ